jgi:two-component SAPR family response regulator
MYEEWATAYRDSLHAAYLEGIEGAILRWVDAGSAPEAIAVARRALEIDPASEELERLLLISYHAAGANAAVEEQYEHYAAVLKNDLGVDPPALAELVRKGFEPQ